MFMISECMNMKCFTYVVYAFRGISCGSSLNIA